MKGKEFISLQKLVKAQGSFSSHIFPFFYADNTLSKLLSQTSYLDTYQLWNTKTTESYCHWESQNKVRSNQTNSQPNC